MGELRDAPQHSKPVRLAAAVLDAAVDQKWPTVQRTMQRLQAECDSAGLGLALVAWCDAFAQHATGGSTEFQKIRMVPWNVDSGAVGGEARESVRWAMDLLAARARGDREAFVAALDRLNRHDGFERGRYVLELVESVALTIRSLPRGYARMGRSDG